jgi:hypothetical protein
MIINLFAHRGLVLKDKDNKKNVASENSISSFHQAYSFGFRNIEFDIWYCGNIDKLIGTNLTYKSDFYIDATGFNRILMTKLNVKWKSFNKYLKLNSAITFPTADENNYNYWTLAKAMNSGWRFKIPTWGRHGNGYIYDNNFINHCNKCNKCHYIKTIVINYNNTKYCELYNYSITICN